MSRSSRAETLLWTGLSKTAGVFSTYDVIRKHLGVAHVLGQVWRESDSRHGRWRAQRVAEVELSGAYRTRRAAACAVARILEEEEAPRSGDGGLVS